MDRAGKNIPGRRRNANSSKDSGLCQTIGMVGTFMPPEAGESKDKYVVQGRGREGPSCQAGRSRKGSGRGASGMELSKSSGNIPEDECACLRLEARSSALKLSQL